MVQKLLLSCVIIFFSYKKEMAQTCDEFNDGYISYFDNQCTKVSDICHHFNLTHVTELDKHNFTQCSNGTHTLPLEQVSDSVTVKKKHL